MVTWHLTMKLFPAKCHERAILRKLWRQTGNSSLYPRNVDRCCWNLSALFKICFRFVLLYNKSLNDCSLGEQWILFLSNLNVSLDFVSENIEILGKQNSLFPSGPVIQCLLYYPVPDTSMPLLAVSTMALPVVKTMAKKMKSWWRAGWKTFDLFDNEL